VYKLPANAKHDTYRDSLLIFLLILGSLEVTLPVHFFGSAMCQEVIVAQHSTTVHCTVTGTAWFLCKSN